MSDLTSSPSQPAAAKSAVAVASAGADRPYLDWAAIFGGAVLAAAISTIMTSFGAAIGLSLTSPLPGQNVSLTVMLVTTALWILWITVSSFAAGGYLAGRMRRRIHDATEHESNIRDGAHGLVVWALGAIMLAWLASATIGFGARTAASVAGGAASAVASSGQQALSSGALDTAVDRLMRGGTQPNGTPAETRQEVGRIVTSAASSGTINPDDKSYLASQIASRTGISQQDAEKRIDTTVTEVKAGADKARQAADTARKYGILLAFLTATSLLIGAAAAWGAATVGGNHRDENVEFGFLTRWR